MSKEIIKQFGEQLVKDIKKALPKASGKTAASVVIDFQDNGFTISGNASIGALIRGRKPTSANAKKGDPTLQESILEWIQTMSIKPKEDSMTELQLSWAISQSIHKNGLKGKPDLLGEALDASKFDKIATQLLNENSILVTSQILENYKDSFNESKK